MADTRFRQHARICFGIPYCKVCDLPFPCRNRLCDWLFPVPPCIPSNLVPYFHTTANRNDPEVMKLERAAVRWLSEVLQ